MITIMMTVKLILVKCKTYPKSMNEFCYCDFFFQCKSLQDTKMKEGKRQTRPPAGESAADAARSSLLLGGGVTACTEIILTCWVCWGFSHLVVLNVTYIPSEEVRSASRLVTSRSSLGRRSGRSLSDIFLLPHSAKWRGGWWQRRLRVSGRSMRKSGDGRLHQSQMGSGRQVS